MSLFNLRNWAVSTSVMLAVLVGDVAVAQDVIREEDKVVYRQKTVIDFSDVTIEGELTKPEGSYFAARKAARFNKLIKVREDFVPEMLKSTDHL